MAVVMRALAEGLCDAPNTPGHLWARGSARRNRFPEHNAKLGSSKCYLDIWMEHNQTAVYINVVGIPVHSNNNPGLVPVVLLQAVASSSQARDVKLLPISMRDKTRVKRTTFMFREDPIFER